MPRVDLNAHHPAIFALMIRGKVEVPFKVLDSFFVLFALFDRLIIAQQIYAYRACLGFQPDQKLGYFIQIRRRDQ